MEKKRYSVYEIKKKISEYKKRLHNLKLQGFAFSSDIYKDINIIEKRMKQSRTFQSKSLKIIPVFLVTIVAFSILLITLYIFFPGLMGSFIISNEPEPMYLSINSISNGSILHEDTTLTGFATQPNGHISKVEIKIDNGTWDKAIETNPWQYVLLIDDLEEGNHTLSIRCCDGENYKKISMKIIFEKLKRPIVKINYPKNKDTLSGIIQINGTAFAGKGELQKVLISFDYEEKWIPATIKNGNNWSKNWDTKQMQNGIHQIFIKSIDDHSQSDVYQISIYISNPKETEIIIPEITGANIFQFFIYESDEIMKPGNIYTAQGFHRKKYNVLSPGIYTNLKITDKQDWLIVTLPDLPIVTPSDYELYTFSIQYSITEDAPEDIKTKFTITATYGSKIALQFNIKSLLNTIPFDLDISTGQW